MVTSRSLLDGNVTDQNDVPVPGASVYLYDFRGQLAEVFDEQGQFIKNPVTTGEDGYWAAYVASKLFYTLEIYWGGRLRKTHANVFSGTVFEMIQYLGTTIYDDGAWHSDDPFVDDGAFG